MRNSFNLLLIGLACFDNVFLLFNIIETFRSTFKVRVTINKESKCLMRIPFVIRAFEYSANSNIHYSNPKNQRVICEVTFFLITQYLWLSYIMKSLAIFWLTRHAVSISFLSGFGHRHDWVHLDACCYSLGTVCNSNSSMWPWYIFYHLRTSIQVDKKKYIVLGL